MDPALESGRAIFSPAEERAVRAVVDRWLDEVAAGVCTPDSCLQRPLCAGGGVMEQPYAIEGAPREWRRPSSPASGASGPGGGLGNMAGLYGALSWRAIINTITDERPCRRNYHGGYPGGFHWKDTLGI